MVAIKLTFISTLLATAFALPAASGSSESPVLDAKEIDARGEIAKRGQGIHLVNCPRNSLIVYCANDGSSSCNSYPSSNNVVRFGSLFQWEGGNYGGTFSTGVVFSWQIAFNAQTSLYPNYSGVGSGTNGFTTFDCFKDDKHTIFNDPNGSGACRAIYYCLPGTGMVGNGRVKEREALGDVAPAFPV
ncbi:hypothetical protein B0T24DRAFT_684100 [Lasiosphaeria ovina]|uniref:Uncharacterized protein n=1 Tax=Lasiosphaeria ovina TaxID=92902 RepID=A0AAE0MZZ3_9PEZI|nr:hypothetical protein B0T24DRAFT_684100 [Lasiosphaeria ovina]